MNRIIVFVPSHDNLVTLAMARIVGEMPVDGALGDLGVEGIVKQRLAVAEPPGGCTLDLIAHSASGVLQFGDWLIDADDRDQIDPKLVRNWAPRNVDSIRLLGCNTAATQAGQRAMRHLAEVFGVPIFGATVPLHVRDFDSGGLSERGEGALRRIDAPHRLQPPILDALLPVQPQVLDADVVSDADVEAWFRWFDRVAAKDVQEVLHRLRPETLDEAIYDVQRTRPQYRWPVKRFAAEDRDHLFAQLVPELATAPGLLAVPDSRHPDREFEALFPADNALDEPRFYRATILLGGRFVRVYPLDTPEGVILRSGSILRLDGGIPVPLPSAPIKGPEAHSVRPETAAAPVASGGSEAP